MTKRDPLLSGLRGPVIWIALVGLMAVASAKTGQTTAPVVEINGGLVRGLVRNTTDGHRVNLYQGIRYGRAKRFCRATPVEPWTGIYEATKQGYECLQRFSNFHDFKQNQNRMSEDCLFLDVLQPVADSTQKRSVMVWIHDGGFINGSSNKYDLAQFADKGNVLVVSINYRQDFLAFVNGGTELEPGNLALYDQILALEWVQQNVDKFGGNSQEVTIFGHTAGSQAIGMLTLSPLTEGLFHRVILQSGAPYENLFLSRKESLQTTLELAKSIGCLEEDDDDGQNIEQSLASALSCLREIPANVLIQVPVSNNAHHGDQLLPLYPTQALQQFDRKLDVLFGVTRDEGSESIQIFLPTIDLSNKITLRMTLEALLIMTNSLNMSNVDLILEHYTKHLTQKSSKDELINAIDNFFGDYLIVCPTVLFGQQISRRLASHKNNHFYAYRLMVPLGTLSDSLAVSHGQDLNYLFDIDNLGQKPKNSETFAKLHNDMVTAWTEFAKTGEIQPVSGVEWTEAIDREQPEQSSVRYFSLDPSDYKMVDKYWKVTCEQIWKPNLSNFKKTEKKSVKTEL